ncbi:MAG: TonB-dependent receptor, partial [Opitutae bacterium]|nr:TonB-dependent receptor [Opitutae bacterium]
MRGLTRADTTRDFFLTDIPLDGYNTDRVEISRGPNAMLFGLGSPAGIINSNLIKARLDRNKGQVEFKYGSNDTHRETLDYNHVLIEDKLAVRIAGLTGEEKYRQNFSFIKDKRGFATATWKPFTNTTIRTHGEWARQDSN